jgi:hypothetical protein
MIHNYFYTIRLSYLAGATLFLSLLAVLAQAQTTPQEPQTQNSANVSRNTIRLDQAVILFRNLDYNLLSRKWHFVLPILVGYERQLSPKTSINAEALVNGGTPREGILGLGLQGRYYFWQGRKTGLLGCYVAPTLGYRAVRQEYYVAGGERRKLGGGGVSMGAQVPVALRKQLVLDMAMGFMSWNHLGKSDIINMPGYGTYDNSIKTSYERNSVILDGRLGIGYQF